MVKRLSLALVILLVSTGARAAGYYFSDCAGPGGSGTLADPWCVIPTGSATPISMAILADGTNSPPANPELAAGDTVFLCAGPCDGQGSGTYRVAPVASRVWFAPRASGTAASPIRIRPYCSSTACETVAFSGDTNGNGIYDSGVDCATLMADLNGARNYYVIDGDPDNTGAPHLIFERSGGDMFDFSYSSPGIRNWTWNGLEVRYVNSAMWSGGDYGPVCPTGDYAFHLDNMAGGPVTISRNVIHHVCQVVLRLNNNYAAGNDFQFINNTVYNVGAVSDNNNFTGMNSGASQTIEGNRIWDTVGGIVIGNNLQHVRIQDNVISCVGTHQVYDLGCAYGIRIFDGDSPYCTSCWTDDIIVRRNTIYGLLNPVGSPTKGNMNAGIIWTATNQNGTFPTNAIIENNMIWGIHPRYTGPDESSVDNIGKGGISVRTATEGLIVQNNTVYNSTYPVILSGAPASVQIAFRNNLIVRGDRFGTGHNPEIYAFSSASGSVFERNNINPDGLSGAVVSLGGSPYDCSSVTGTFNNAQNRIGNDCQSARFVNVSGPRSTWNLDLSGAQYAVDHSCAGPATPFACSNASRLATEDIHRDPRFLGLAPDIGADEYAGTSTAPTASLTLTPIPPQSGGTPLLRPGTWSVSLSTSVPVVSVPALLSFTDSGGRILNVPLSGGTPGALFTGSLTVDTSVADGSGILTLGNGALVDAQGNSGNTITSGSQVNIDTTPPMAPTSVQVQ